MSDLTPHERTAAALARSSDRVAALLRERADYRAVVMAIDPLIPALKRAHPDPNGPVARLTDALAKVRR